MSQATAQVRRVLRSSPHKQESQPSGKKSLLQSPGALLVAAFGSLFVGYVFNVRGMGTSLDNYFNGLNSAAQGHQSQVASTFIAGLPLVGAAVLVLVGMAVLRALGPSQRTLGHVKTQEAGVEIFVADAGDNGVSHKVGRAAYRLLLPHVRKGKRLGLNDTLCTDLKVRRDHVSDLYGALLRYTDRRRTPGDDAKRLNTVIELLLAVEVSEDKTAKTTRSVSTASVIAFQGAAATAPPAAPISPNASTLSAPVPLATALGVQAVLEMKAKKAAVLVHPARLDRREMSMIRSRTFRKTKW